MKKIFFTLILCLLVLCPFEAAYPDIPYLISNIDHPYAEETYPMDINNFGKIAGYYYYAPPVDQYFGFTLLGNDWDFPFPQVPDAIWSYNTGINDVGSVVGVYCTSTYCGNYFFHDDEFMPVIPPCPASSQFWDLNNYYWIAGYCGSGDTGFIQSGANPSLYSNFLFPGASYTKAYGINDNYVIVGSASGVSYFGTVTEGFTSFQVPGASHTEAYGINNGGQIVGDYYLNGHCYGFVRETDGKIATIHVPNSTGTYVFGINEFRQLVGNYRDSGYNIHAFRADPVASPLPADLIVSSIVTDPPDPDPGEAVDVHVTVENQGTYDAGGFFLDWYANESSGPAPPPFGNRREYVPGLAAGATYTMSTTWTYSTSGTYQIYAYVDTGYGVYEESENNNVLGPVEILVGACACDLNSDGSCNGLDWLLFYPDWGRTDCTGSPDPCECDLNTDGSCNGLDWLLFYPDWGRTDCP
jgi:hypothetical protein